MKVLFLGFAFAVAIADLVFFQVQAGSAILFFAVLKLQADHAAARFVEMSKTARLASATNTDSSWIPPEFNTNHGPVADKNKQIKFIKKPISEDKREQTAKKPEPELKSKQGPKPAAAQSPKPAPTVAAAAKPSPKKYSLPKFTGKPHEVLGVQENAVTNVIVGAFRHWMKEYHPDHAKPEFVRQATEHARKIADAKQSMMDKRRKARAQKAA